MHLPEIEKLLSIRAAVAYLGEKEQFDWWSSSFFAKASSAFLAPVFPRTQLLAQCQGVTLAASRVHDERIGVGQVYHLFRLPEDIEQAMHRLLMSKEATEGIAAIVSSKEHALGSLEDFSNSANVETVGPTRVGDLRGPA